MASSILNQSESENLIFSYLYIYPVTQIKERQTIMTTFWIFVYCFGRMQIDSQYGISENPRRRHKIKNRMLRQYDQLLLARFLFAVPSLRFSISTMGRLAVLSLQPQDRIGSRTSGVERKKQRRRECGWDGWPNAQYCRLSRQPVCFLTPIRRQAFVYHAEDLWL